MVEGEGMLLDHNRELPGVIKILEVLPSGSVTWVTRPLPS